VTYLVLEVIDEMRLLAAQLQHPAQPQKPGPLSEARP
jgi:hypothetical protein